MKTHICFVCFGNYCRSPLAEGVFNHLIHSQNSAHEFFVDSAGIKGHNAGKPPDPRSIEVAAKHGVVLSGTARQFQIDDFNKFDIVIAMDLENRDALIKMSLNDEDKKKIHLLREFDPQAGQDLVVPDPYYGGAEGFETVYEMIERSCRQLLEEIKN